MSHLRCNCCNGRPNQSKKCPFIKFSWAGIGLKIAYSHRKDWPVDTLQNKKIASTLNFKQEHSLSLNYVLIEYLNLRTDLLLGI